MSADAEIRAVLDRWEYGQVTHWAALAEIRRLVGGENTVRHNAESAARAAYDLLPPGKAIGYRRKPEERHDDEVPS